MYVNRAAIVYANSIHDRSPPLDPSYDALRGAGLLRQARHSMSRAQNPGKEPNWAQNEQNQIANLLADRQIMLISRANEQVDTDMAGCRHAI
jgi:hypothetical protein